MTKSARTLCALLMASTFAALMAASPATAHGNPAASDIDTRVLEDCTDLALDYGGANGPAEDDLGGTGQDNLPIIPLYEGGHDLIALDVREGHGPSGDEGLYFRLMFRRGAEATAITDIVTFSAGGQEIEFAFETQDNVAFSSSVLDWVSDKFETGQYEDGVDGFASYATLGIAPLVTLENFFVESQVDGARTDYMPGGYVVNGVDVPRRAGEACILGADSQADFTADGPDEILSASGEDALLLGNGPVTTTVTVSSNSDEVTQTVDAVVSAAAGLDVQVEPATIQLTPDVPSADVTITVDGIAGGMLDIEFISDIGGRAMQSYALQVEPTLADQNGVFGTDPEMAGFLETGQSYAFTFDAEGAYPYHSHANGMEGLVNVGADEDGRDRLHVVRISAGGFLDDVTGTSTTEAEVGDTVLWVNEASEAHSIEGVAAADHGHGDGGHGDHGDELSPECQAILDRHEDGELDEDAYQAEAEAEGCPLHGHDEESPGIPLLILGLALVALVALRRR